MKAEHKKGKKTTEKGGKNKQEEVKKDAEKKKKNTSDGTRTRNPRLRRPMPYPLGYGGSREGRVEYYSYQGDYARLLSTHTHTHSFCWARKHRG